MTLVTGSYMRGLVKIFLFVLGVVAVMPAQAQSYYTNTELGISLGASQYFGDLNENYGFKTITPAYGVYVRRRMSPYIALKLSANYTQVSYDDKYNSDLYEKERNLNFTSPIFEVVAQAEFNFFKFVSGDREYRFTPYLTGGIGVFYYNPYTTYNGEKYYLRALGTEGQNAGMGSNYGSFSACFPIGAGFKYWIKSGINLCVEVSDRLTTTDYIDDVSSVYAGVGNFSNNPIAQALQDRSPGQTLGTQGKQRGNTSSFDQYLMGMVSISFNFTSYKCPRGDVDDYNRVRK